MFQLGGRFAFSTRLDRDREESAVMQVSGKGYMA